MHNENYLKTFSIRHALGASIAVLIAILADHFFSFSHAGWTIIAAYLVSLTTRGTPARQGLIYFLIIITAIIFAELLLIIGRPLIIYLIIAFVFLLGNSMVFIRHWSTDKVFFRIMLIFFMTMIAIVLLLKTAQPVRNSLFDVVIGSVIGIFCSQFIFPAKFENEFRTGIAPILKALVAYSQAITEYFLDPETNVNRLTNKKIQVEKELQIQLGIYPEWVFEVGFNPGLRKGFRFFLVKTEQITDLFCSMSYLVSLPIDKKYREELENVAKNVMQKNEELLEILIYFFEKNKLKEIHSDFTSDVAELENTLRQIVPSQLELLDISPDYLTLTAWARDIKDMRELLLQLVNSLPVEKPTSLFPKEPST